MELFATFALLWRHRLLLVIGAVVAVAVGWKAMQGETTRFSVATARVVLDTPTSQVADTAPIGADTLTSRAAVLADLAQTDALRHRIAERMRIKPDELIVKAPYLSTPRVATPLPEKALEAAFAAEAPYVIAIGAVPDLPIIAVDSSAPRREDAGRLVTSAIEVLKAEADAHRGEPDILRFMVEDLAPLRTREIESGPRRAMGLVAAVFVFGLWCFGVMALAAGIRTVRYRRAATSLVMDH
jgi:hypothetical protein